MDEFFYIRSCSDNHFEILLWQDSIVAQCAIVNCSRDAANESTIIGGIFEEKFSGEFVFDPMWGLPIVNVQSTKGSHGHLRFTISSLPLAN